jgi:Chitin synthase
MLAVTYGLQVSSPSFLIGVYPFICRLGDHLYPQEGIHACRLDGCISPLVRFLPSSPVDVRLTALSRYPVYSFFLPIYSFWCMDEFGWGNTRLVIGEGKDKKVIVNDDEKFDDSMIPLKKFSGTSNCQLDLILSISLDCRIRGGGLGNWHSAV